MYAPDTYFHSAPAALTLRDRLDQNVFDALYARTLVYNLCWEDPAVDRRAPRLGADDTSQRLGNRFWQRGFAHDGVYLTSQHLRAPVPYLPGLRVPYYLFVGVKPKSPCIEARIG